MSHEQVISLLALLEETLADGRMVDAEKRQLAAALEGGVLSAEEIRRLRNQAFGWIRERVSSQEQQQLPTHDLLKWLEGVVKVLDGSRDVESPGASRAYFSPGMSCLQAVQHHLRAARKTVDICVFTISDDRIADEILATHQRQVAIRLITDNEKEMDQGSDVARLREQGIPVAVDRSEAHMHHKFAIFDGTSLLNGSYNWTRSASIGNQENLVLSQDKELIRQFAEQFESLWSSFNTNSPRN